MAGPLGVSHLLLFSRSLTGNVNLRVALMPRGPTLHFRVEKYSLCKDVRQALRHPKGGGKEYLTPPLLVMNNFTASSSANVPRNAIPKQLETLVTSIFQSLFPPISPQSTSLSLIRRVLLLDREPVQSTSSTVDLTADEPNNSVPYILNVRHYAITTKTTDTSRGIRRIKAAESSLRAHTARRGMPNLGRLEDVADYLLDPSAAKAGFTSGSESELETDAEVEVLQASQRKVLNKKQMKAMRRFDEFVPRREGGIEKRVVRLVEMGPRMKLRLTKIEDGVCSGKVMWHEYLSKNFDEVLQMENKWESRRHEKEERRRIQRENVEKKRSVRNGEKDETSANGMGTDDDGEWNSDNSQDHKVPSDS